MIVFKHKGDFNKTEYFLKRNKAKRFNSLLEKYGAEGVEALRASTPKDSGDTASSWKYEVVSKRGGFSIIWSNTNSNDGIPIIILIQYGHGTRSGSFIQGRDVINPVMHPLFDRIAENLWKEVTRP